MEPLISIIVPVYKVEQYLRECIDSIINQTYKNLEIILVDDGSPDNCGIICDEYSAKDPRIKVIHKENGGQSDARNHALNVASGEFFSFVDSDDWIEPDMIETMIRSVLASPETKMCCCGRYDVYPGQIKNGLSPSVSEYISTEEFLVKLFKKKECDVAVWDKLFHCSLFENVRFPIGEINEEVAVIFGTIKNTSKVAMISKRLYNYRHRPSSTTHAPFTQRNMVVVKNAKDIVEICDNRYPSIKKYALCYYSERLLETCIKMSSADAFDRSVYSSLMSELNDLKHYLRPSCRARYYILSMGIYSKIKKIYTTARRALCTK